MKKESGEIDGYKWEVEIEESLGGDELTYYRVEAPDGEEFCCDFTTGPLEDGVFYCKAAIKNHKNGICEKCGESHLPGWPHFCPKEDEVCPKCGSDAVVEVDDHYDRCYTCGFEWVG